jgi:hypothetical protein
MSGGAFHNDGPSDRLRGIAVLPAGPVGTHSRDNAANLASLAALGKRNIFGALHGFTLNQRPRFFRNRESSAPLSVEAQFNRALARSAIGAGVRYGRFARQVIPGNPPFVIVGAIDD